MYLASSLPYMMVEHLPICPCDPLTNNQYCEFFDCNIPFKQHPLMCFKTKKVEIS